MTYASCPTVVVHAPIDIVWKLLTQPARWGDFFDLRITGVEPAGPAVIGQRFCGEPPSVAPSAASAIIAALLSLKGWRGAVARVVLHRKAEAVAG